MNGASPFAGDTQAIRDFLGSAGMKDCKRPRPPRESCTARPRKCIGINMDVTRTNGRAPSFQAISESVAHGSILLLWGAGYELAPSCKT
jgi:hypothetical protein